jgi:hypothetical protein
MKKVLWVIGVILILCGVLLGVYIVTSDKSDKETSNTNDGQELDTSKYEGYTFTDIKTYDESTNGNIVYTLDETTNIGESLDKIVYSTETTSENSYCLNALTHTYSIENGKVTLKASNGKSHTFTSIKNAVSILDYAYQDCNAAIIAILTSDNNIYIRHYEDFAEADSDVIYNVAREDDLIKISSDLKIEKIGYTSVFDSYGVPTMVAKTTDGKVARVTCDASWDDDENTYEYYNYRLELTDEVLDADGIIVHEDATVTYGNVSIVDENSNKIYALGIYAINNDEKRDYDVAYILDRQGYLYQITYADLSDNMKIYKAKKYSDKIVKKVGTNSNEDAILLFEDGEELVMQVVVGDSSRDHTFKLFQ